MTNDIIIEIDKEPPKPKYVYAIDFDGTLCEDKYPRIGKENTEMISKIRQLRKDGHKIILWTCRCGEQLRDAKVWCMERGIIFDAVNDNLPELVDRFKNNCRKVYADYYIDDKSIKV